MNGYYPLCFSSETQYEEWRTLAIRSGFRNPAGYCTDCSPAYQDAMIVQGRCKNPSVNVEKLLRKEMEDDMHQEVFSQGAIETFSDPWTHMTDQLTPLLPAPLPPKKTRNKRSANVKAV